MIRIVYFGTPDFACPALKTLLAEDSGFDVVAVVTQPDKPAGRGRRMHSPAVKVLAEEAGCLVLQPPTLKAEDIQESLKSLEADFFVVAAYGKILPQAVLDLPKFGCINIHASILPAYRGASPIAHAILAGDKETGVAIMQMEAGLDTGPVFKTAKITIHAEATTGTLTESLALLGAEILPEVLLAISRDELCAVAQDDELSSYAPLIKKQEGWLDFSMPGEELERKVRAYSPWPGTFVFKGGQRIKVLKAAYLSELAGAAGEVLEASGDRGGGACGSGALALQEVQPAGKKAMSAAAWIAGRAVNSGESFDLEPSNH